MGSASSPLRLATGHCSQETEDLYLSLQTALRNVLDQLTTRTDNPEDTQWADDEYTYLELKLCEASHATIDLCIHQGRAFVRIEK